MKKFLILGGIAGLAYLAYTQGWLAELGLAPTTAAATPPAGVGNLNSPTARQVRVGEVVLDGSAGFAGAKPQIVSVS